MVDNLFAPLTFIAGPAILTNACAIMQNSATMRYNLAITQWREFRASLAGNDGLVASLYADPSSAVVLAERRLRLLLSGLNLLYVAVGLFGAASFLGLLGAFLARSLDIGSVAIAVMLVCGGAGLLALLGAALIFLMESRCAVALLHLQLKLD